MALIRSRFRVRAFSRVACCLRVAAAMALMALVTAPPATAQADAGALSGAAKIHYQRAAEELRSGDAEAALLELDQAVQLAPDSARVLRLSARALAQAGQSRGGLASEFVDFLKDNKKWWLAPIIISILGLGLLVMLGGTAAAPFIYTLF